MRYLYENILKDLNRKMVFIGGPRQVGKTTLSKKILAQAYSSGRYFNWDYNEDRQALLAGKWHDDDGLASRSSPSRKGRLAYLPGTANKNHFPV